MKKTEGLSGLWGIQPSRAPQCGCPPMHPSCPPNPSCPARDIPLQQMQPIANVPDELEMRAAAFGIPIGQRMNAPTNLEQFEKLVDRQEAIFTATSPPAPSPLPSEQEEETGEISAGLGSQSDVRRAPAIHFSKQNITANSSESKQRINVAAEERFGGNVDVICSRGHFSYVFSSNLYCEAAKDLVTCIAFRQTPSV
ncbi:ground-like domain protein [Teladorsagia circumcincta]|uniref:Ground-like domain protein n=1 Tax=Teladorsagia circumcincta TaxID=45464 RepID=A0A2G9UU21_TELCI|nr:ground-like domain protein [Teladorsagia circumcincta]